jgi:hypothetical protein
MSNMEKPSDIIIGARLRRRRGARLVLLAALGVVVLGGSTAASYYVDALWFESLGYASVFWTRLSLQAATFAAFALVTFLVVYGAFRALKPDRLVELIGATILINRRPVTLPVEPVLKLIGLGVSVAIAAITGASMMERWMTMALFGSVAIRDRLVCCWSFLATGTVNDRCTEQGHQADALPAGRDAHLRALVCGLSAEPAPP